MSDQKRDSVERIIRAGVPAFATEAQIKELVDDWLEEDLREGIDDDVEPDFAYQQAQVDREEDERAFGYYRSDDRHETQAQYRNRVYGFA